MEAERDVCVCVRACRGWHVSLWGLGKWCPVTSTNAAVNYYSHKFIPRSRLAQGLQLASEEGRVTGEMLVCVYIFLFEASSHSLTVIFRLVWWNAHIDCMTKQQELGKSLKFWLWRTKSRPKSWQKSPKWRHKSRQGRPNPNSGDRAITRPISHESKSVK